MQSSEAQLDRILFGVIVFVFILLIFRRIGDQTVTCNIELHTLNRYTTKNIQKKSIPKLVL